MLLLGSHFFGMRSTDPTRLCRAVHNYLQTHFDNKEKTSLQLRHLIGFFPFVRICALVTFFQQTSWVSLPWRIMTANGALSGPFYSLIDKTLRTGEVDFTSCFITFTLIPKDVTSPAYSNIIERFRSKVQEMLDRHAKLWSGGIGTFTCRTCCIEFLPDRRSLR